jgi:PIN domain nuclease of toxin-antitoxin system
VKGLLDTHILLYWLGADPRLSAAQAAVIQQAIPSEPLWMADISLWEIATLYTLGRITLNLPLQAWLEAATATPLVQRVGILPAIAAAVAALPAWFHRDPADRILLTTAQILELTLLTRDQRILHAALVPTLAYGTISLLMTVYFGHRNHAP